jgi:translation initiation factor 2 subunit 2
MVSDPSTKDRPILFNGASHVGPYLATGLWLKSQLSNMDYESSLNRAMDAVPDIQSSGERLSVPDAEAQKDGAFTRLTNLEGIADTVSRSPDHLHRFIQRDLGTNGKLTDGVGRYNGTFSGENFDESIESYVESYVLCAECGLPDTRLVTEDGTPMLRCDACGAFRPISKRRRGAQTQQRDAVEEGQTYTFEIVSTGRKGDGVAERGEYTVFVPGASEGDIVEAYIENVSGSLAFARLVSN